MPDLRPLPTSRSSANPTIVCLTCAARLPYHDAVRAIWYYDPAGPAYEAYYCHACGSAPPATCSECHRPISKTQAGLSRLRWDDAPPACQDCCTAALTAARERFEAHQADDPHCTCNDCIAAHFERPPARCRHCGAQAGEPTTTDPWTCPDCLDAGN